MTESRGGDNRPSVYFDPDINLWVYRASALGRCDRELVMLRRGAEGEPVPDWLMRRFNEGHEFEDELLRRFSEDNDTEVIDRQRVVEIPVGKGAIVRGSIDGRTEDTMAVLVDAKFLGPDKFREIKKAGIAGTSDYKWQQTTYGRGLIAAGEIITHVCLAMGLKEYEEREDPDTGETYKAAVGVADMHYEWLAIEDLPSLAQVKGRVLKLEKMAGDLEGDLPACPVPFQFPCSTRIWHDEPEDTAVELEGTAGERLTVAHRLYVAGSELEKGGKKLKAEAGDMVRELLVEQGLEVDAAGNKLRAGDTAMTWVYSHTPDEYVPEALVPAHTKKGRTSAYPKFSEAKEVGW